MREAKCVKAIFEDGTEKICSNSKEFCQWYVEQFGGPESGNINLYGKMKGTDKSFKKHGIKSIEYC